jgi:hypothetical protein
VISEDPSGVIVYKSVKYDANHHSYFQFEISLGSVSSGVLLPELFQTRKVFRSILCSGKILIILKSMLWAKECGNVSGVK